jgi:nucleoid-associated protein YgaU
MGGGSVMSTIQFWLSYNNGAERTQLPVNPSQISITSPFGNDDITVSQLGEYTIIGDRYLKEFSFNSFFPRDYNEGYCEYSDLLEPWQVVETIERWRDSRMPIRLTVTGTPINYAVTIREFDIDPEKAGNVGDIYFSMSLKEFKFVKVRKIDESSKVSTESPRINPKSKPKTYTVKSGDNLFKISQRTGIGGNNWRKLYDANKKVIGNNPNLIYPGQTLVIPNV